MSRSSVLLANSLRLASETLDRTDGNVTLTEQYQRVSLAPIGPMPRRFGTYMRQASGGDPTNMAVNGSVTPVTFDLAPASDEIFRIDRLVLTARCATAPTLAAFGNLAALTNGVLLEIRTVAPDALVTDTLDGVPIKSNADLLGSWSVSIVDTFMTATWSMTTFPIRLDGALTDVLRATVRDNISTLTLLRLQVHGGSEADFA